MDSIRLFQNENKTIKKAFVFDKEADTELKEYMAREYPAMQRRPKDAARIEQERIIYKNQKVADKQVCAKFHLPNYNIEQEKVFLYEDKKEDAIVKKIQKYRTFSDENNAELKNYSVRFTNRSAGKRADSAKDAHKLYRKHNRKMLELVNRAAIMNTRDGEASVKDVRKFFKETLEAIDLRKEAMIAAARVKSTSKEDELFRIAKINREMAKLKSKLAARYAAKYEGKNNTLSSYFRKSYIEYFNVVEKYSGEYEKRFTAVKGNALIEMDNEDEEFAPEDSIIEENNTFLIVKKEVELEKHYDNKHINSVRGAIEEIRGKYESQLGAKDRLFNQKIVNNRIPVKNHNRKGHEYSKDDYVIKFNVLGTNANFENYGLADTDYKRNKYFGMPVNNRYGNAVRVKVSQSADRNQGLQKVSIKGTDSLLGGGQYSIDNTARIICEQARERLKPVFDSWEKNGTVRKPIHLMFSGVSRGGVSASLGAMAVNEWISREYPEYVKYVKYDIIQHDPVPGPFESNEKNQIRIGGATGAQLLDNKGCIKGTSYKPLPTSATNSTVFYCFHPDNALAPAFQPQKIYGANKIILTAYGHGTDGNSDGMFKLAKKNRKDSINRTAFLNNENGEFYSGTGVIDLEDGVYVLDEFDTLTKLKSYEDAERIFNRVRRDIIYSKRKALVLDVVKYWFATHQN